LPLGLICETLGVPPGDEHLIGRWGAALLETLDNPMPLTPRGALRMARAVVLRRSHPVALLRSLRGIASYARDRLDDPDPPPEADVLRTLQAARHDDVMSPDEAVGTWTLMVIAGHETTANLIGTTMHLLLAHQEQRALVDADPGLVPAAVREALRLESPVPLGVRIAERATTVAGVPAPAGTNVVVLFGAANRDPDVFREPARFDVRRDPTGHLAFGLGSHFCVGAQLALVEAEIAVERLLRRRPRLRAGAIPSWRPTFATRGIACLPVDVDPQPA
jgi:cytochrome P450